MNDLSQKSKNQITNYVSKYLAKQNKKNFINNNLANNSFRKGLSNDKLSNNNNNKFKTSKNSPEKNNIDMSDDLSSEKYINNISNNINSSNNNNINNHYHIPNNNSTYSHIKKNPNNSSNNIFSSNKLKEIIKESMFDNLFMKKMNKIYNKNSSQNSHNQLAHSNLFNSQSNNNLIHFDNSIHNNTNNNIKYKNSNYLNYNNKANFIYINSNNNKNFFINKINKINNKSKLRKSNSSLEDEEFRSTSKHSKKPLSPRDSSSIIKEKDISISGEMNHSKKYSFINNISNNTNVNNFNYNYNRHMIKSANVSKSKIKNKNNNINNGIYIKKNNSNIMIKYNNNHKNSSIYNYNNFIVNNNYPFDNYKKLSKTAFNTKNNSRKNSNDKNNNNNNNHYHHSNYKYNINSNNNSNSNINSNNNSSNIIITNINNNNSKKITFNNNNNNISKSSLTSLLKQKKTNNNNVSSYHIKNFSEIPNSKYFNQNHNYANNLNHLISATNNNNNISNKLLKSSQITSNSSKNYINMNDIKYYEYITSNLKNNSTTTKNKSSSISNKNKKEEKDYLQMKLQLKYKNAKSLTTVNSKHNSKTSISKLDDKNNKSLNKEIVINKNNFIYNPKINIPLTTTQSPKNKSQKNILKNGLKGNFNLDKFKFKDKNLYLGLNNVNNNNSNKNYILSGNNNIETNVNDVPYEITSSRKEYYDSENTNKFNIYNNNKNVNENNSSSNRNIQSTQIPNIEIQSIQSTIRESIFYRKEMEKVSQFIKQYHYTKGKYPDSSLNFYKYGRLLGRGAFGKVNLALHICSGHLVAVKSFNKKHLKDKRSRQKIFHEIKILSQLRNQFVSQIFDSFETDKYIIFVMEYICGDLLSFIRKRSKLNESTAKIIFKQIIEGLKYIHSKNIVHRDIKLDNILIDLTNTIKICDFGVSRKLQSPSDTMHEKCGTPAYIAPEIFKGHGYEGYACDIWSAGVTLYYMVGGIQPFKANNLKELQKVVIQGKFERLENVSPELNDLISGMLIVDPKKRMNINQILNHPWLINVNNNNRFYVNLFTNAEKVLLSKYDVDYLNSSKEELIENFTLKNLESIDGDNKEKGNTKSLILAPYNSYANDNDSLFFNDLNIENNAIKFNRKSQQFNIKYELNNNKDCDNGIIKTQKEEDVNNNIDFNNNYNNNINDSSSNNLSFSKPISPNVELNEEEKIKSNLNSNLNSPRNRSNSSDNYGSNNNIKQKYIINNEIIKDIENTVGYDKKYLINCIKKNEINYATATYYLLLKDYNNNNNILNNNNNNFDDNNNNNKIF